MAKNKPVKTESKSVKTESNLPKRKKLSSHDGETPVAEIMDAKGKTKKRKMKMEEAPVQIPSVKNTEDDGNQKKARKRQKKQKMEISDAPSAPAATRVIEGEEDLSPEERRVLERKMKKILKKEEKKRLKAEGETTQRAEASGPSATQLALDYLTCWVENRSAWKFQKIRQTWLLQNMFESTKIPAEKFTVLLQYLEGLCGGAKDKTVQKALSLVEASGQAPEDEAVQQRAHRAREVIQLLS